ncbi:MAG: HipA domain-containing protein [Gammaproteobacteria bacterium]
MICLKCHLKIENVTPHYGLHPKCFVDWFQAQDNSDFSSIQRRSSGTSDKVSNQAPQNTSFFHGKFKKYSAELNGIPYILKMRQKEAPELPEVEYLCNQIASSLKIPIAEFYFIEFHGDRTFVTKNFIPRGRGPIDLQHIYHFRSDNQHSCSGLIKTIIEQTKQPYDVKILIKTILFDSLIGNHDRHGRNLAFIKTANTMSLSPIYDNVSYLSLESGNILQTDFNPTGRINTTETTEPTMRDYVKELKNLSYEQNIVEFYKNIKLPSLNSLIDKSFCSVLMKKAIKKLIKKRFEELENELFN